MADRAINSNRPLKPTLASNRIPRTPLTPRLAAGNATPSTVSSAPKAASNLSVRSEPPRASPRTRKEDSPLKDTFTNTNVTPRSSARKSRVDSSQTTPTQTDEAPSTGWPRSTVGLSSTKSCVDSSGARSGRVENGVRSVGTLRGASPPLPRSPGRLDLSQSSIDESIGSRFFHASDVAKQEPPPKKQDVKKPAAFFYADGQVEGPSKPPQRSPSPALSSVSEKRSSGPWIRADSTSIPSRSPPLLSPALSSISQTSPFFATATGQNRPRSPSPSKENIHLSYRKGVSQIIGTRPLPRSTDRSSDLQSIVNDSNGTAINTYTPHRKSPSLSSIDSSNSQQSRRRSATHADTTPTPSPLNHEVKSATVPRLTKAPPPPSIDTTLASAEPTFPTPDIVVSPSKSISELAADARRERKVLDLEISNSSLLAINASLEREIRRQKAELKRFRRLTRSGRFSLTPGDSRVARLSDGLSTLGEEEDGGRNGEYADFGPPSGFTDVYDDFSSDEDDDGSESVLSSGAVSGIGGGSSGGGGGAARDSLKGSDRLAQDEKRLRVDLEKHKELLVQSQMMNQSLKRCLFSTESMIAEGKKALAYHVKVSDVKLGGRILTGHEDEEEGLDVEVSEIFDDEVVGSADHAAKDFLDTWRGVGGGGGGDRDSGIEVDKPAATDVADSGGGRTSLVEEEKIIPDTM